MIWYAWVLVAMYVAASLIVVHDIGKPRRPMTSEAAVIALIINGLALWATVALALN